MPPKPKPYIIDADTFMQSARTYYSFSRAATFWNKLVEYGRQGRVLSIDKVLKEINDGKDELKKWANRDFKNFFLSTQKPEIYAVYSEIVGWAEVQPLYKQKAIDELLEQDNADAWIVSHAKVNECTVVTFEKSSPNSENKIFIPDICNAFDIECKDIFEMLDDLGFAF